MRGWLEILRPGIFLTPPVRQVNPTKNIRSVVVFQYVLLRGGRRWENYLSSWLPVLPTFPRRTSRFTLLNDGSDWGEWGWVAYKVLRLEMTANHFIIHKFLHRSLGSVWVMPSLTSRLPWWADSLALTYTTAILLLVTCDALSVVLIKGSPSLHQDSWNCCFHQKRHSQYNLIQITINFSPSIPNCDFEIVYSYRSGYQKSGLMKFILVCLLRSYTDHTGYKNICT